MPLHVSNAKVSPERIQSGQSVTITVDCHVMDKELARGGGRYTIPVDMPVFFEISGVRHKRAFLPEFRLTTVPTPRPATLKIVADAPTIAVPIDVEIADLDENPPETRTRAVTIDVR